MPQGVMNSCRVWRPDDFIQRTTLGVISDSRLNTIISLPRRNGPYSFTLSAFYLASNDLLEIDNGARFVPRARRWCQIFTYDIHRTSITPTAQLSLRHPRPALLPLRAAQLEV